MTGPAFRTAYHHRNLLCTAIGIFGVCKYHHSSVDEKERKDVKPILITNSTLCDGATRGASSHGKETPSFPIANAPSPQHVQQIVDDDQNRQPILRLSREPRLKDKIAIISGASRGLGRAIAIKFVQEGAKVVLLDINDSNETLSMINQISGINNGGNDQVAIAFQCDISNSEQVQRAIRSAIAQFGPQIDILVNNACAFVFQSVEHATIEDWTKSMNVNILGHAILTQQCLPYMKHAMFAKKSGHGPSIIFQGSISSFLGQPNCATYATMKGAIVQLARNCAYDFAKYNIRVNTICPGTIETPISQRERDEHGWSFQEWQTIKTNDVFLGRVGVPMEVANAAVFFASEESSYCSGSYLMVDGGASACTVMETKVDN